jgi:SAM-dependent methyltransferase
VRDEQPAGVFDRWVADLERRHLAELTFPEVSRALRALSSAYVERRHKIGAGGALAGAGKRAAFALFYGPLHYLLIAHIVDNLPGALQNLRAVVDLGCGTGAAGAAWAAAAGGAPRVTGIDRHPWALEEAATTYRAFGVGAVLKRGDIAGVILPAGSAGLVAAFTVNELPDDARDALLPKLLARAARGDRVLVVEPIAGFVAPWWTKWQEAFRAAGGRADEWRVRAQLPPIVMKLDRAAGMNHRELTGRSLWIG